MSTALVSLACTSAALPKAPRGGKGADKRFAAYDAECARIAAQYCGASVETVVSSRMNGGNVGMHRAVSAVSIYQGARCLGVVGTPEVARHLGREQRREAYRTAC